MSAGATVAAPAAERTVEAVKARGATLFTGVPCSSLAGVIDCAIADPDVHYVGATSEGEAVGIAAGAWLAGGAGVVLCQNSGLGNMVNPLTSLTWPSRIPLLVVCGWRGRPGAPDEPQHQLMGRITPELLDLMEVPWRAFRPDDGGIAGDVDAAWDAMAAARLPFCLLLDGTMPSGEGPAAPAPRPRPRSGAPAPAELLGGEARVARAPALERLLETVGDEVAIVATTGKTSRELFTLADRPQHFYCCGAMGCASAIGLGVALGTPRRVVVVDGDGAALMKLGNLASVGVHAPPNLVHVVLDNGVHDSTGGQATVSDRMSLPEVARACGYRRVTSCTELGDLGEALRTALTTPGPHLVHVRIRPGSMNALGRPTVSPSDVAERFRRFVAGADGSAEGVKR
jgi:phosphonopyruvate decarboxylase